MSELKINEEVVLILVQKELGIVVEQLPLERHFINELNRFEALCKDERSTIDSLVFFLKYTTVLKALEGGYKYCKTLGDTSKDFIINISETIKLIQSHQQAINYNVRFNNVENYNPAIVILKLKEEVLSDFKHWLLAYSLRQFYKASTVKQHVLAFSHRRRGWDTPKHQLNDDFSIKINTNFGFGRSSYFNVRLTFKGLKINCYSDWINYEYAQFSQIVTYTRKFKLLDNDWTLALNFSKDACNLAMNDEVQFLEEYVIDECERLASGLEKILVDDEIKFRDFKTDEIKNVDKEGAAILDIKGSKISGALDFIASIMEFESIISIQKFIPRLENVNKQFLPILVSQTPEVKDKLAQFTEELEVLKPNFEELLVQQKTYQKLRLDLVTVLRNKGFFKIGTINMKILDEEFDLMFPEYEEFCMVFGEMKNDYEGLISRVNIYTKYLENLTTYRNKIEQYFQQDII